MSASPTAAASRARATHLGPERRRPLILDVAFGLFLERGYKGTSMEAIARAAGVTKPVIYACFASKAELFGALLDREEQRMFAQFGASFATGAESGDLEAMLVAGFTAMLQAVSDTPETYRVAILGAEEADALIDARVRRGREHLVAQLSEIARRWLEGQISTRYIDENAEFAAQTQVGVGEAGLRMMLASPDRWTPEALGRALGRFTAAGYAALEENDIAGDSQPPG
jgi:AcrR family transcriptional regulator